MPERGMDCLQSPYSGLLLFLARACLTASAWKPNISESTRVPWPAPCRIPCRVPVQQGSTGHDQGQRPGCERAVQGTFRPTPLPDVSPGTGEMSLRIECAHPLPENCPSAPGPRTFLPDSGSDKQAPGTLEHGCRQTAGLLRCCPRLSKKVPFLQVRKMPGASGTQVREPQPTVPWLQERLLGALRSAGFAPGCAQIQDSPDETRLAEDQLSGSRLTQFPGPFSQRPAVPCCTGSCLTMG